MKVVHINTYQTGGAGMCAKRICDGLNKIGAESKLLVAYGSKSKQCDVIASSTKYKRSDYWTIRIIQRILNRLHIWPKYEFLRWMLRKAQDRYPQAYATLPVSYYEDLVEHPWLKDADVVHLHWVADFVDYPTFFQRVNKPIVWTFHDENVGLGCFHYSVAREEYKQTCYKWIDRICCFIKKRSFTKQKLHIVALSQKMSEFAEEHKRLRYYPRTIIHNGVNTDLFKPIDKKDARNSLGLGEKDKVFLFSSFNLFDKRKGLQVLIDAFDQLEGQYALVCLGHIDRTPESEKLNILCPGFIESPLDLSIYYSAADYFVMPSFQEAFAQAPLEAMACGTPVIAFPCSGAPELVNDKTGIVCEDFSVDALVQGIKKGLLTSFDPAYIRSYIESNYSDEIIANQYSQLYNRIIGE